MKKQTARTLRGLALGLTLWAIAGATAGLRLAAHDGATNALFMVSAISLAAGLVVLSCVFITCLERAENAS